MANRKRGNGEGSIYQMADGRWRAALSIGIKNGKPARKVYTAGTRNEVQKELTKALRNQQLGIAPSPERLTLGAFLDHWLESVAKPNVRPKTLRTYQDLIRLHIRPGLGNRPLAKLSPSQIRAFLNDSLTKIQPPRSKEDGAKGKPLSSRTVKHLLITLRGALETAVKDGILPRNVARLVDPPRSAKSERFTFSPEQARSFLEAVRDDRLEALFTVAASIGMRQGEILGLMLPDVDLEAGTLTVRAALQRVNKKLVRVEPKSQSSRRTINLPGVAVSAIVAHLGRREQDRIWAGDRWQETGYLFATPIGTPIDARRVIRRFHAILTAAGLPRMRFHDLRHSAATLLLAQGVSPRYITDLLGHSQVSFTMQTYAHVLAPVRKEVAAKMDEILRPRPNAGNDENRVATSVATKPGAATIN